MALWKRVLLSLTIQIKILHLLIKHLKNKWIGQWKSSIATLIILLLGTILPTITISIYGESYFGNYFVIVFVYQVIFWSCLILLAVMNKALMISRMIQKFEYASITYKFMNECYHKIVEEYDNFIKLKTEHDKSYNRKYYDRVIMNTIYIVIFELYFNNLASMEQSCDAHLTDMNNILQLYHDRHFMNYYSRIFFSLKESDDDELAYQTLVKTIRDDVCNILEPYHWFGESFNEDDIIKFIEYVLNRWFSNIIFLGINKAKLYGRKQSL